MNFNLIYELCSSPYRSVIDFHVVLKAKCYKEVHLHTKRNRLLKQFIIQEAVNNFSPQHLRPT